MEEDKLEVGTRVQKLEDNAEPTGGVVEVFHPAEMEMARDYWNYSKEDQEKMKPHYTIKWDDGETQILSESDFNLEDNDMEREFRKAALKAEGQIQKLLDKAARAISEAEELSEQYGVPFSSSVSPIGQSYYPTTTESIFPDLDRDFIDDITGAYHSDYGEEGWQHSDVC